MRRAVVASLPWAAVALCTLSLLAWEGAGSSRLLDPDSWMRLAFVRHAVTHGGLFDYHYPRDGAPEGMQVMWTIPFDAAVAIFAAPLAPFVGWGRALALTYPAIGPFWLLAGACATGRLAWQLGLRRLAPWAALVAGASPALQAYNQIGRVSHHGMTLTFAVMAMSAAIGFVRRPQPWQAMWAGLWAVMCCWQSMETLPAVLAAWSVVMAAAALRRTAWSGCLAYAATMGSLGVVVLGVDPDPRGLLWISTDRYSLFHCAVLAALGACAPLASLAAGLWGGTTRQRRLCAAAAASMAVLLPCVLLAVVFAPWPIDSSDSFVNVYLWQQDTENRNILQSYAALGLFPFPVGVGLLHLLWGAWSRRRRPVAWAWLMAAALLACEVCVGLASVRLVTYAASLSAVPCAAAIASLVRWLLRGADEQGRRVVVFGGAAMASAWLLFQSLTLPPGAETPGGDACPVAPAATAIESALPVGAIVAAEMWATPELLWTTRDLRTIAGPYHRNFRGLQDLSRIFMSTDQAEVQGILKSRGAVAVLTCASSTRTDTGVFEEGSLQRLIEEGHPPEWLEPVPLPASSGALRLYRLVVPKSGSLLESRQ